MSYRVTADDVRKVIETDPNLDMMQYIKTANVVTNRISRLDTDGLATTEDLEQIELYLAAHYYSLRDAQYTSKSTGAASGAFLERNWWEEAKKLDPTGTLAAMETGRPRLTTKWLGKPVSERVEFWDRN